VKYRFVWLAIGWALIILILWLSLIPSPPSPLHFPQADKVEHLFAYGVLMSWFCQIYHGSRQRLYLMLAFIALGATIEILQGLSGYRTAEWGDLLADSLGVLIGWLLSNTGLQHFLTRFDAKLTLLHDRYH